MADLVNLTIDGKPISVPKGTLIVDAAKTIQNDIPVFCYHPKLKPVGMCRMCLVEIGTPKIDPATKQVVKDEQGNVVIAWQPKLNTACTNPVSEGMAVRTANKNVNDAREDVLEFLLTSHPLDCPICDKGGECPLQNLTLEHGPGLSRFDYSDKQHNDKHVPLGEQIFLDQERCIQCSRCIRFQDDVADDHVIQFFERGRRMEIMTLSDPGFDSYFGGNTTDICPVGALTTADFRFKARPWELDHAPSVCNHCAVGCNTSLNTRLDTKSGLTEIKRIMPRQNEQVNEIWLCDKGRFVHHYTRAQDRLIQPMVRRNDKLVETTWDDALRVVADLLQAAGANAAAVVGDRIANEDAYLLGKLFREVLHANNGSKPVLLGMSPALSASYADVARGHGVGRDFDMKNIARGDTVLVVNGDVEEQAPVWFLRLRQAVVDRGAKLIVAHHRPTKMHRYASQIFTYAPGTAAQWLATPDASLESLKEAKNLVVVFGDEALDGQNARALAIGLARLIVAAGHAGKPNSGLLPLYAHGNTQGVFDVFADGAIAAANRQVEVAWMMGVGNSKDMPKARFTIVSELFMTDIAKSADVVLPALSFAEREGSYTSADRRVQRFYRALAPLKDAKPDWLTVQEVARRLGQPWSYAGAGAIFMEISTKIATYAGISYEFISKTSEQWPPMGRADLYYGGTVYDSEGGLGARYGNAAERGDPAAFNPSDTKPVGEMDARRAPRKLYQAGELITRSPVLQSRVEEA